MKRFLLSGIMLLSLGCMNASAQSSNTYDDDIYYSSDQARADAQREAQQHKKEDRQRQSNPDAYSSAGDNSYQSSGGSNYDYANGDDYIDYEDDYYYASHINRFSHPFYNMGYYSGYYNPYWYDRTWTDPAWGYNPWQSASSISFGYGPYWSSGWGYNTWYGYSPFYSYYSYPYYGGYGGYYGCGSPYYSGYWNGYYSGVYGGGAGYGYRNTSYGPRTSLNSIHNTIVHNNSIGHRSSLVGSGAGISGYNNSVDAGPHSGFRGINNSNNGLQQGGRNMSSVTGRAPVRSNNDVRGFGAAPDRNGAFSGSRADNTRPDVPVRSENPRSYSPSPANEAATPRGDRRGGFFGGRGNMQSSAPRTEQRPQQPRSEAPRMEQRTFSQPRMESAPSRSFGGNSGGGRSFGGGNNGGSGGGRGFGGRR